MNNRNLTYKISAEKYVKPQDNKNRRVEFSKSRTKKNLHVQSKQSDLTTVSDLATIPDLSTVPDLTNIQEMIRNDLRKDYERMTDRRVTSAVKKKEKQFAERIAKLRAETSEQIRVNDEEHKRVKAALENELVMKHLQLDVVDAISEFGIDIRFRKLIVIEDLAGISDEEARKKKLVDRVRGMKELFDREMEQVINEMYTIPPIYKN